MQIIDAHHHLLDQAGYLDRLLRRMDELHVTKVCLSGLGTLFDHADDQAVRRAFEAHGDRIIGAVFVRPGVDGAVKVRRGHEQGFRMVKATLPRRPYDDPAYDALWQCACELKMPVLFHTGIVTTAREAPGEGVSSWHMHPMRLERISREFPQLNLIAAHLGICWNLEAAELARIRPNVYVDLTGTRTGWRVRADRVGMESFLWWPDAFDKVVFGTDVAEHEMAQILSEDVARLRRLEVGPRTRERVFSGNMLGMLG